MNLLQIHWQWHELQSYFKVIDFIGIEWLSDLFMYFIICLYLFL